MRWASAALVSPIRGRSSKTSTAPRVSPSSRTSPRVGCICAAASCSSVVFPAPFGPSTTQRWSASTVQSTPRSRWVSPRTTSTRSSRRPPRGRLGSTRPHPTNPPRRRPATRRGPVWHDAAGGRTTRRPAGRGPARAPRARWARTGTAPAPTSRCGRPARHAVDLCLFDADGAEHRHRLRGDHPPGLARPAARRRPRPALRLPGARPLRPARRRRATTPPSCCSTRTPGPSTATCAARRRCSATRATPSTAPPRRPATPRRTCRAASSSTTRSRGTATGRRAPPWSDTVIYEVHVKGATALHPDVPPDLRGTYAGLAHPAFVEHLQRARRDRRRAAAGAPLRQRAAPAAPRADATTGATTPSATSPRTPPTLLGQRRRPGAPSSRRWSRRCTPPASR